MNDSPSPAAPPPETVSGEPEAHRPLHTRLAPWLAFWALVAAGVVVFILYLPG